MRLATLIKYATILVMLCGWSPQISALELDTFFKRKDQRAIELINDGQHEEAIELLDSGGLRGVSRYRSGDYENALEDFATGDDAVSFYNHGTAAARLGDYDTAVASLEKALEIDPVNQLIRNNLQIARKLRDMNDEASQENKQDENNQEDSDQGESQDGDSDNSEQSSESESTDSQQSDEQQSQQNGELAESAVKSGSEDSGQTDQQPEDDAQSNSEEQRQAELEAELAESEDVEQAEPEAVGVSEPVSEDDQATQQWLRRIPDDGSQLLRNKIKLNKYLEYPEVQDQPEAW